MGDGHRLRENRVSCGRASFMDFMVSIGPTPNTSNVACVPDVLTQLVVLLFTSNALYYEKKLLITWEIR